MIYVALLCFTVSGFCQVLYGPTPDRSACVAFVEQAERDYHTDEIPGRHLACVARATPQWQEVR